MRQVFPADFFDPWRDPWFYTFACGSTAVSMASFAIFAAVLTLIAWRDPAALRPYRIQSRPPRAQTLVLPSIARWLVNNVALSALIVLTWPLLRQSGIHDGPTPPAARIAAEVVFFIYLDDFLFYWMHRAMHAPWLYKRVHSVHHRIRTPWAVTGHYMHPAEYVATGTLMLVGPLLVGAHVVTLWCWIIWRQWEAAEGHCGYDFPWSPTHLLPGNGGATHHDLHHAKIRGNYAGFLAHVDRWFGTLLKP